MSTEDIGIVGLDEIKIDDLEVIQFLENTTAKNITINENDLIEIIYEDDLFEN